MAGLLGRFLGGGPAELGGEWGPVCPVCGRYDWPQRPVRIVSCRSGAHRVKGCRCGHAEVRFDCEDHG